MQTTTSSGRRARPPLLVVAAALLLAALGGGCGGGPSVTAASSRAPRRPGPSASTSPVIDGHRPLARGGTPTSTEPAGRPPALRGLAVTTDTFTFVDSSRPVVSGGQELATERSLPTYVWLPQREGAYPLVVFASGFDQTPENYAGFCSALASSGYVVAAPSFPLADPTRGFPLDRSDLPNEAGDVSFVLTSLLHSPLASHVEPGRYAVVGHSDGADVALMVGYEAQTADPRFKAVVADAPDPIESPVVSSQAPLLLVQGTADEVVPYSSSQEVFSQLSAVPRYYLSLIGADHLSPIQGPSAWTSTLQASVADFLDATVAGRGPGPAALPQQLGSLPLSTLETGGLPGAGS